MKIGVLALIAFAIISVQSQCRWLIFPYKTDYLTFDFGMECLGLESSKRQQLYLVIFTESYT